MIFTLDRTKMKIPQNPPIEFAEEMLEKAKGCTEVVSKGGGSTIDVGKYVAFHLKVPHTAIPTTAGTGSEVSKFAVFLRNGKRWSMENEALIPDNYKLQAELVITLPKLYTISSGLDALSQSVESWWSPDSTKESRKYAKEAIHLVTGSLADSVKNPTNEHLRMNMLQAANYSGKAINITKTSICHAISYPLTVNYGIKHGIACAMTLPIFMRYFGMHPRTVRKIENLIYGLGIRKIEMGNDIVDEALASSRSKNTPKLITRKILRELI